MGRDGNALGGREGELATRKGTFVASFSPLLLQLCVSSSLPCTVVRVVQPLSMGVTVFWTGASPHEHFGRWEGDGVGGVLDWFYWMVFFASLGARLAGLGHLGVQGWGDQVGGFIGWFYRMVLFASLSARLAGLGHLAVQGWGNQVGGFIGWFYSPP